MPSSTTEKGQWIRILTPTGPLPLLHYGTVLPTQKPFSQSESVAKLLRSLKKRLV